MQRLPGYICASFLEQEAQGTLCRVTNNQVGMDLCRYSWACKHGFSTTAAVGELVVMGLRR